MHYRCPVCHSELGRRKYGQAVIARMEIDCSHCMNTIKLNVHRYETAATYGIMAAIVVLGGLAYALDSQFFMVLALGAVTLGAGALPLIEHVILRDWPRYVAKPKPDDTGAAPENPS